MPTTEAFRVIMRFMSEDRMTMKTGRQKTNSQAGELIQLAGLVIVGAGIAVELVHRAHIFLVIITVGSIIFAIGTKLKGK